MSKNASNSAINYAKCKQKLLGTCLLLLQGFWDISMKLQGITEVSERQENNRSVNTLPWWQCQSSHHWAGRPGFNCSAKAVSAAIKGDINDLGYYTWFKKELKT